MGEMYGLSVGKVFDVEQGYKFIWLYVEDMVGEGGELEMVGGWVSIGSECGMEMKDSFDLCFFE